MGLPLYTKVVLKYRYFFQETLHQRNCKQMSSLFQTSKRSRLYSKFFFQLNQQLTNSRIENAWLTAFLRILTTFLKLQKAADFLSELNCWPLRSHAYCDCSAVTRISDGIWVNKRYMDAWQICMIFLIFKVLLLWMLFIMAFGTTFFLIVDKVSVLYYKSIKKSNVEHLDNSKSHTAKFGHLFWLIKFSLRK